jgi:twitching motility protein PilT
MLRHAAGLVGLQRADEMPDQPEIRRGGDLGQRFLQLVLAEFALARRRGAAQGFDTLGLAHRHQPDRARVATADAGNFFNAGADLAEPGGDVCHWPACANLLLSIRASTITTAAGAAKPGNRMDIAQLLTFSVKQGASDLHLSAGLPPMIRVDGDVRRINLPAMEHKEVYDLIYDIMNDKQRKDFEEFLETDFSFEIPGLARFRVNAFNHNRGAGGVFRTIPSKVLTLEQLNCPPVFKSFCDLPRGIVLVTGPTGSGKSTTLAAMINHINENEYGHILTVEDPIEFVHESKKCLINQREVHRDTLGFNEALRSALREDPDTILVGEMRDLETIRLALTAAETGHLVFGTLHTSSAAKTIDRVVDVFPAAEKDMIRAMLSESLQAVISQTLLKKKGGGRVAAHEIMVGTPAIRNLIREAKVAQMYSAIQTGQKYGMQTLDQCLQDMVRKGLVAPEQARVYMVAKETA